MANKEVIFGLYSSEDDLLTAIKKAKGLNLEIMDVLTPFPVHGLDPLLELKESRLHIAGFIYGLLGTLTAFIGMTWIFTKDWPLIFGGKPYFSLPAFIPIIFETTVLFSAIGMTVSFFIVSGMGPGVNNPILDDRITDDKFCIAFDKEEVSLESVEAFFSNTGAETVKTKSI